MEQDEASNDIFIVSVGAYVIIFVLNINLSDSDYFFFVRLQPGSKCHITISYVSELDLLHSSKKPTIRFVIPTTIAPRYSPAHGHLASPAGTGVQYTQSVPYTVEFTCQVDKLDQNVASISSPSHPIKIDISNEENFFLTFAQQDTTLE